jgi:hypothetical protein
MKEIEGIKYYTKEELIEGLRGQIEASGDKAVQALITIYRNQTYEEQYAQKTIEDNGVGFNGVDAEICTSIAQRYLEWHNLTPRQLMYVRKAMPKYAAQLINQSICTGKIKCKCRGKYYW